MPIVPFDRRWVDAWAALRAALWPEQSESDLREDASQFSPSGEKTVFFALDDGDRLVGFAEAALRRDYVNGCETSPVAFLEAIYVAPTQRRRRVASALCDAVEAWARTLGCRELASDALLDNRVSHRFHEAAGFAETERVVYFRKGLLAPP